jgi:hypothetical protein
MSGLSLRGCMQIVEEKAHSERALLLTVKELEARLAGLDSEKEAVISRSIVNLRYHHPLACMTTLSCGGVSDCSVSECVLTVCACVCMCVCVCVPNPWMHSVGVYLHAILGQILRRRERREGQGAVPDVHEDLHTGGVTSNGALCFSCDPGRAPVLISTWLSNPPPQICALPSFIILHLPSSSFIIVTGSSRPRVPPGESASS